LRALRLCEKPFIPDFCESLAKGAESAKEKLFTKKMRALRLCEKPFVSDKVFYLYNKKNKFQSKN